jgi:thiol-disulfide isomerase/thioredoxin
VLVVVLAVASAYGLLRRRGNGRFRRPTPRAGLLDGTGLAEGLGERATLLQFSSAFCAPCRATRSVLAQVADVVPGVTHLEVDAEHHLDLVRRAGVVRTPTTLVLDAAGTEVERAGGVPRRDAVLAVLARVVDGRDQSAARLD